MKTDRRKQAGAFTLVEIMVALTIFGLVLAAIYSSWTAILRASKVGLDAAARVQRERIAVHTLEDALSSAISFAGDVEHYGFVTENGNQASLSFVASLPESFPRGGKFGKFNVRRVTFSVESGPNYARQLVLRQNLILMDMDIDEQQHPLVLARNVQEFSLGFWDLKQNDWVDEWPQTNQLPKWVKFTLRLGFPNQQNSYAQTQEAVTRVVSLPAISVPARWQGRPGG
jgi:type II secretion system protein J